MFLYCCTAVEAVAPSLSFPYSRLFSGIYNRPGEEFRVYFSTGSRGKGEGKGSALEPCLNVWPL